MKMISDGSDSTGTVASAYRQDQCEPHLGTHVGGGVGAGPYLGKLGTRLVHVPDARAYPVTKYNRQTLIQSRYICPLANCANSTAPTGQSDSAGSAKNDYYYYPICMRRSKTPKRAEGMHKPLKPAA